MEQAALQTEQNNRLAHSLSYRDPVLGYFGVWGYFCGI